METEILTGADARQWGRTVFGGNRPQCPREVAMLFSQGGGSDDYVEFHRPLKVNDDALNPQPVKGFLPYLFLNLDYGDGIARVAQSAVALQQQYKSV